METEILHALKTVIFCDKQLYDDCIKKIIEDNISFRTVLFEKKLELNKMSHLYFINDLVRTDIDRMYGLALKENVLRSKGKNMTKGKAMKIAGKFLNPTN